MDIRTAHVLACNTMYYTRVLIFITVKSCAPAVKLDLGGGATARIESFQQLLKNSFGLNIIHVPKDKKKIQSMFETKNREIKYKNVEE